MCKFWSSILVRPELAVDGKRVLWLRETSSHSEIIEHFGLTDRKIMDRDFVKYEITPGNIMSSKRDDWNLRLDEERTLPEWYAQDTMAADKLVWAEWRAMVKEIQKDLKKLNIARRDAMIERVKALRPGDKAVSRSTVKAALNEHVKRLNALDQQHRELAVSEVRFYTASEWASVWASVRDSVWDSVWASVRDSVWASVRDSVWASVRDSVRASVWDSVWASVRDSVRASVWDSVWASVRDSVWASVILEDELNYAVPLIDCLEAGCVLYGIDKDGVAHVLILGKDAEQPKEALIV